MAPRRRTRKKSAAPPRRWLALALALLAFAGALYVLVSSLRDAPLADIDAASRAQLERVLERADRETPP